MARKKRKTGIIRRFGDGKKGMSFSLRGKTYRTPMVKQKKHRRKKLANHTCSGRRGRTVAIGRHCRTPPKKKS